MMKKNLIIFALVSLVMTCKKKSDSPNPTVVSLQPTQTEQNTNPVFSTFQLIELKAKGVNKDTLNVNVGSSFVTAVRATDSTFVYTINTSGLQNVSVPSIGYSSIINILETKLNDTPENVYSKFLASHKVDSTLITSSEATFLKSKSDEAIAVYNNSTPEQKKELALFLEANSTPINELFFQAGNINKRIEAPIDPTTLCPNLVRHKRLACLVPQVSRRLSIMLVSGLISYASLATGNPLGILIGGVVAWQITYPALFDARAIGYELVSEYNLIEEDFQYEILNQRLEINDLIFTKGQEPVLDFTYKARNIQPEDKVSDLPIVSSLVNSYDLLITIWDKVIGNKYNGRPLYVSPANQIVPLTDKMAFTGLLMDHSDLFKLNKVYFDGTNLKASIIVIKEPLNSVSFRIKVSNEEISKTFNFSYSNILSPPKKDTCRFTWIWGVYPYQYLIPDNNFSQPISEWGLDVVDIKEMDYHYSCNGSYIYGLKGRSFSILKGQTKTHSIQVQFIECLHRKDTILSRTFSCPY